MVFLNGELMAVPIPLEREVVTLGRALEADVRINDAKTSRLHAQIITERDEETGERKFWLSDLNSKNGTLLNGHEIQEALLQSGDKIGVGNQLLRFEMLDEIDREFQMQIYRLIAHDELTGLLSSRSFFFELRREAARATTENRPFCVLMMDLDFLSASTTLSVTSRAAKLWKKRAILLRAACEPAMSLRGSEAKNLRFFCSMPICRRDSSPPSASGSASQILSLP